MLPLQRIRGCFNLGLITTAFLPLASLANALVSECQAELSVPVWDD